MNIMETTVELTILPPAETGLALLEDDLSAAKDYLAPSGGRNWWRERCRI